MVRQTHSDKLRTAARVKTGLLHRLERAPLSDWPQQISQFVATFRRLQVADRAAFLLLFTDLAEEIRQLAAKSDRACASRDQRLSAFWKAARSSFSDDEVLAAFERELIGWLTQAPRRQQLPSVHVQRVKAFVREHYSEPLTIKSIAEALGRQHQYLATLFRREAGLTLHEYLTSVRLHRAWDLIRGGEKIEAVTLLVGYRSKKSLYHHFKVHVGVPPGKCRKPERPPAMRQH